MEKAAQKRAMIIAQQAQREATDRAEGRLPPLPDARASWAGGPPRARRRGRPPSSGIAVGGTRPPKP
jgi:hypothetical protein